MEANVFAELKEKASLEAIRELKAEYSHNIDVLKKLEEYEEKKDGKGTRKISPQTS